MVEEESILYKDEVYDIIGACMEVHSELGNGFLEAVYHEALVYELNKREIPFESNKKLKVHYKNILLQKSFFADFVCHNKIILELKAMDDLHLDHESQLKNYLKATGLQTWCSNKLR
jgi:GxxExxY protein